MLKKSVLFLVILMAIGSVYSMIAFQFVGKNISTFYQVEYNTTKDQMEIRKDVQTIIKRILWAVICEDNDVTEEQRADLNDRFPKMSQYVDTIYKNLEDETMGKRLTEALNNFKTSSFRMLELVEQGKTDEAVLYYKSDFLDISEVLATELGNSGEQSDRAAESRYRQIQRVRVTVTIILIIVFAITVLLALVLTRYLAQRIVEPIDSCARRLHLLISNGDLHSEVPKPRYRDETGLMLEDLNETISFLFRTVSLVSEHLDAIARGDLSQTDDFRFAGDFAPLNHSLETIYRSLNETMGQIGQAAGQVAAGSSQVSDSAQSLSSGASSQAASVEELVATIGEISQQIEQNAVNARAASQKAVETGGEMARSNARMQEMTQAMDEITESSNQIGKIIKTIEDIAFQTNILALNAAVEAARAGAAGKGFSVVADEVRNLAGKSSEASQNTSALIESALTSIDKGAKITSETAQALSLAVDGAKEVADTISHISAATEKQAASIAQVSGGIDQISGVVQNNSATAEESAAASQELSGQAQLLEQLVDRFKLRNR